MSHINSMKEFLTPQSEEIVGLLEKYPTEKRLTIDYKKLESFDAVLADLLIKRPGLVIPLIQRAIKEIDPLIYDANISIGFENVSNVIPFNQLTADYVGQMIRIDGRICDVKEPVPKIKTGIFECKGCLRLHKVDQNENEIVSPKLCPECGGRTFELFPDESTYVDTQLIKVTDDNTSRNLKVCLTDDNCSFDEYYVSEKVQLTGVLKTYEKNGNFEYYLECYSISKLPDSRSIEENYSEDNRNDPVYKIWVRNILNRDKVCQCCGGGKHLEAHHIFGYKNHPDYRTNPDNGIALCKWCHGKYHSYYGLSSANPQTLVKFIKRFGKL